MEVQNIEKVINYMIDEKTQKYFESNNTHKNEENEKKIIDENELKKLENKINNVTASLNFEIEFQIHKESKRFFVKIVDKNTKKVIREIPPEQLLQFYANFEKMLGLLFNGKT